MVLAKSYRSFKNGSEPSLPCLLQRSLTLPRPFDNMSTLCRPSDKVSTLYSPFEYFFLILQCHPVFVWRRGVIPTQAWLGHFCGDALFGFWSKLSQFEAPVCVTQNEYLTLCNSIFHCDGSK